MKSFIATICLAAFAAAAEEKAAAKEDDNSTFKDLVQADCEFKPQADLGDAAAILQSGKDCSPKCGGPKWPVVDKDAKKPTAAEKKAAEIAMKDEIAKAKEAADAEKKRRDALTAEERKAEDEAAVEKAKSFAMCVASCLRCSNFKVAGASSLVLGAAAVATAFALM